MNSNKRQIKKTKKKVKKIKKQIKRTRRQVRATRRRFNNRLRKLRRGVRQQRVLQYQSLQKKFKIERTQNNTMVVSGTDLVYKPPDVYMNQAQKVIAVIPSNPAYWKGTRISTLASCYQQYRPIKFKVHYNPTSSAFERGVVFAGALTSNQTITADSLEQTLSTAPGKMNTQVAKPKSAIVSMKDVLSKRLYTLAGDVTENTNPFFYVAIATGNFNNENIRITPGYFWISYKYMFKNALPVTTTYYNTGLTLYKNIVYKRHTTIVNCSPFEYNVSDGDNLVVKTLDYFTQIQLNKNNQEVVIPTYEGDFVPYDQDTQVWAFQCESASEGKMIRRMALPYYDLLYHSEDKQEAQVTLIGNRFHIIEHKEPWRYSLYWASNDGQPMSTAGYNFIAAIHRTQVSSYAKIPYDNIALFGNAGTNQTPIAGHIEWEFYPEDHQNLILSFFESEPQAINKRIYTAETMQLLKNLRIRYIQAQKEFNLKKKPLELDYAKNQGDKLDEDEDVDDDEIYYEEEEEEIDEQPKILPQKNEAINNKEKFTAQRNNKKANAPRNDKNDA